MPLNIVILSSIINIGVLEEIKQGYDELVKVWPSEAYLAFGIDIGEVNNHSNCLFGGKYIYIALSTFVKIDIAI